MKKYIFSNKKNNKYFFIFLFLLILIIIYLCSFYIISNKYYFVISNNYHTDHFIIPEDKEGEKVKFIDKKSINNLSSLNDDNNNINSKNNLNYTIQIFSDINYANIEKYISNILDLKSEIISADQLFIFSINSEISNDYFITYKNFETKNDAMNYCKKLSFVKKCIIINYQFNKF